MAVGLGGSSNFFWNPHAAPADGQDYSNTDWGRSIQEQNPNVAYYRALRNVGVPDDQSAFSRWAKQQFPNFSLGYGSYTATNPLSANVVDYAASLGGYDQWMKQFMSLHPQLRGEDAGARGGGPVRWVSR